MSQDIVASQKVEGRPHNSRLIRDYVRRGIVSKPVRKPELDYKRSYYGYEHLVELLFSLVMKSEGWSLDQIAEFRSAETTERMVELLPDGFLVSKPSESTSARSLVQKFRSEHRKTPVFSPRRAALEYKQRTISRRKAGSRAMQQLGLDPKDVDTKNFTRLTLSPWCHIYFDTDVIQYLPDDDIEAWGSAAAQMVIEHIKKNTSN